MRNNLEAECRWDSAHVPAEKLENLQAILNCASHQGCGSCVRCSEQALELFLRTAKEMRDLTV